MPVYRGLTPVESISGLEPVRDMQLKYELIEDHFEEITQMRTKTEQARLPGGSWLIRTVMYTPYLISADVTQISVAGSGKKKKKRQKKKDRKRSRKASLFDPIS